MTAARRALALAVAGIALADDKRGAPGRDPTLAEIDAAVAAFMRANPITAPKDGRSVTDADVDKALKKYLRAHPIENGKPGKDVKKADVREFVFEYLVAHPPKPGDKGRDATQADVMQAVAAYFKKNPIKEPAEFDDVKVEPQGDLHSYKVSFHHSVKGWIEAGTFRVPRPSILANRRVVFGASGGDSVATYDDYEQVDTRPVQSGAGVLTFTFDAAVQLVKIHPLANDGTLPSAEARQCWAAADGDLTPAIGVGDPCQVGSSEHLFGNRTSLKVYAPAGVDCFVTGYRRKAV